eukprot:Gb_26932 [translate_table: standard]
MHEKNKDYKTSYNPRNWLRFPSLFFDGASKNKPGTPDAGGVVLHTQQQWQVEYAEGLGSATNNYVELEGLIASIRLGLENGIEYINIKEDSMLVVDCINGKWKMDNLIIADLTKEAQELVKHFKEWEMCYIFREANEYFN